jgi:YhcH/YjgK/YiaL family protein
MAAAIQTGKSVDRALQPPAVVGGKTQFASYEDTTMILSRIEYFDKEQGIYPPAIRQGLRFLRETDFSNVAAGRHAIDGANLFALVQDYEPEPKADRRPEAHRNYIDIQYIVSGRERIGYAPLTDDLAPSEDLLAEKDVAFYAALPEETDLLLSAGAFAVFFPWDVHRPCCAAEPGTLVRKVVVKVRMQDA